MLSRGATTFPNGFRNVPRFTGFRGTLYHSIGTQTENNSPSYFDRPLGIFGFYKSRYEKVPEGLPQNQAGEKRRTIRGGMGRRRNGARDREKEGTKKGDTPRANSLLAACARGAVPNPWGTAYTLFPAHPLDPMSTLHSPSPSFRCIPSSPFPLSSLSSRSFVISLSLFLSIVSHSLLRCTKLQFITVSLAPVFVFLFFPLLQHISHSDFPALTTSLSHPPATPLSSVLPTSPSRAREYTHSCPLRSLFSSVSRSHVSRRRRSARRRASTGVANSLLVTSASLGRSRAPIRGIHQYAPRCLAGKLYVVDRFSFLIVRVRRHFPNHEASRFYVFARVFFFYS